MPFNVNNIFWVEISFIALNFSSFITIATRPTRSLAKKTTPKCAVEHVVMFEVVFVHLLRIEKRTWHCRSPLLFFLLANGNCCRCESSNRMNLTCSFTVEWWEQGRACAVESFMRRLTMLGVCVTTWDDALKLFHLATYDWILKSGSWSDTKIEGKRNLNLT